MGGHVPSIHRRQTSYSLTLPTDAVASCTCRWMKVFARPGRDDPDCSIAAARAVMDHVRDERRNEPEPPDLQETLV